MQQNMPTPAQVERLAKLNSELSEAQKEISNILMHGWDSYNPTVDFSPDNRQLLTNEMGDVMAAMNMLIEEDDLDYESIKQRAQAKAERQKVYLHYQVRRTPQENKALFGKPVTTDPWETQKQGLLSAMRRAGLVFYQGVGGVYSVEKAPEPATGQVVFPQVFEARPEDQDWSHS